MCVSAQSTNDPLEIDMLNNLNKKPWYAGI